MLKTCFALWLLFQWHKSEACERVLVWELVGFGVPFDECVCMWAWSCCFLLA